MIKNKFLGIILIILFTFLAFSMVNANENFSNFTDKVSYEFEFTQKYVVAGERVLNIEFENNSQYDIETMEFEVLLKDPFGEKISDWNSFVKPDFKIKSGEKNSLTLSLTRRNVLGVSVSNVLDEAESIELRYNKILLEDGTVIEKDELHPELKNIYGDYEVNITFLNSEEVIEDDTEYNFDYTDLDTGSKAYSNRASYYEKYTKIKDLLNAMGEECLLFLFEIKNISNEQITNRWSSRDRDEYTINLLDDRNDQYNNLGLLYEPQSTKGVARGRNKLFPDVETIFVIVFDKIDNYTPEWIKVYINENEHHKKFEF